MASEKLQFRQAVLWQWALLSDNLQKLYLVFSSLLLLGRSFIKIIAHKPCELWLIVVNEISSHVWSVAFLLGHIFGYTLYLLCIEIGC